MAVPHCARPIGFPSRFTSIPSGGSLTVIVRRESFPSSAAACWRATISRSSWFAALAPPATSRYKDHALAVLPRF
ncbi:hypothetical protein [Sorangium sp. So ce1078]|uniref:hypothetical protein n=1 Tax=Sorangium sp. So ce1078 TaxID=3133329 RepID=UPI003F61BBF1